jgi:hypothetical protein
MSAVVLVVAAYAALSLLWLLWRWDRPLTTPRKRKPRRS